jgi:hypothetical protein
MKLKNRMDQKKVLILVCILLGVLFAYLYSNSHEIYETNSYNYRADNIDAIKQRIDSLFLEINDLPQDEGTDLLYLGRMSNLNKLINSEREDKTSLRAETEDDFRIFMEVRPVYYQLRYIDESGMEVIRVDQKEEGVIVTPVDEMQRKNERYYFNKAMNLGEEEIYVSTLDLNVEDGVIENRGTKDNPEYVPVIRYAMPVFADDGERKGILVFNVYADYFLEDIRRLSREGEESFLIDNKGYYLANSNRSKEFSFMFTGDHSISSDYGGIGNDIIREIDKRYLEDEEHIFTVRYLYPTIGTFEIYQGSKRLSGEHPEEEYYWILVSVSHKSDVNASIVGMKSNFVVFILISALIILVIMILLFVILAMNARSGRI